MFIHHKSKLVQSNLYGFIVVVQGQRVVQELPQLHNDEAFSLDIEMDTLA